MKQPDIKINGEAHVLCVFQVTACNVLGHPKTLELIEPEQTVKVAEGMRFITAWVPAVNFEGDITG